MVRAHTLYCYCYHLVFFFRIGPESGSEIGKLGFSYKRTGNRTLADREA